MYIHSTCWVSVVSTAGVALACRTAFLTFLYLESHANEHSCPPVHSLKFSFLFFQICRISDKKKCFNAVIFEASLNADLLLFLVTTQLSACTSIPIQCNWMLNKNKARFIKFRCKVNCSKPSLKKKALHQNLLALI